MIKFLDDLQRWTEAQVAAILRGRIWAKRKDYLVADINKLLRDRINDPLTIKVGDKVLAEFLRSGGRFTQIPVPTPFAVMDHGWLQYTSPTLPASVYADATLASYLAGAGTVIPGGDDAEHLIGPMAVDAGRSCQSGYNGITWTTPPTLDIDLKYASHSWAATAPANSDAVPHRHSGLGVAFAQALLGVGRKFSDVLPAGWTYDPTKITLVRGPDRAYWLAKIDSAGCFLTRLNLPAAYFCVDYWLANDLLTGYAAGLAEAIVLGNLTLPESPTIYEALSASGISGVYADSAIDMPGWGWQWRTQRHGELDEVDARAILVTLYAVNPTNYLTRREVSRTCRLRLMWSAGLPTTATITITTSGQWRLNELYIKVFNLNASETTLSRWDPLGGITFVTLDVEGPLAAWYGTDGAAVVAKWSGVRNEESLNQSWENPWPNVCGVGTVILGTDEIWGTHKVVSFQVGTNIVELRTAPYGAYSTISYHLTVGSGGPESELPGMMGILGCDFQYVNAGAHQPGDVWTIANTSSGPGASTYYYSHGESFTNIAGSLVVAFGPPRSMWVRRWMEGETSWADLYSYTNYHRGWHATHTQGVSLATPNWYAAFPDWADDTARNVGGTIASGPIASDCEAKLFVDESAIPLDPSLAWWSTLWALGGSGTTTQVPLALISRGGLAAYMDAPGASPTWEMPVSIAAPAGTVRGWVGGV